MSLYVKRLSIFAAIGGLLATTGCAYNSPYDSPYRGYSNDGYWAADRDSAYERGYRDAERSSYNQNYRSHDYEKGYERGKKEAKKEAKEQYRNRDAYRQPKAYDPPGSYVPPSGHIPKSPYNGPPIAPQPGWGPGGGLNDG